MSMRGAALSAAFGWSLLCAGAASALPVSIDEFGTAQSVLVSGGSGLLTVSSGVAAADAIGGARNAMLTRLTGYGTDALTFDGGGLGRLDLSSAAADTVVARLLYDGDTDDVISPTGLGGADLTSSDSNTLIRILARSDLVAPVRITVYSDGGNASSATRNLPGLGFGAQAFTTIDIPFADFAAILGAGADFHSVGAIVVELSGEDTPSLDAQLDSIVATVPEPATAALFALGIIGLAVAGRRRA